MSEPLLQITTTTSTQEEGLLIARALVDQALVACAQLSGPILSVYTWQGDRCEEQEYRLTLKTRGSLFKAVQQKIQQLHSYQVPQIIAVLIERSSQPYEDWLLTQTQPTTEQ